MSRRSFLLRSSRGDRLLPAPVGVPVERLVGMGLTGPLRVRPASGVWASPGSRPVPPRRVAGRPAVGFAARVRVPRATAFAARFRVPEAVRAGRRVAARFVLRLAAVFLRAGLAFLAAVLRAAGRGARRACFRRALTFGVFAAAVFRRRVRPAAAAARLRPPARPAAAVRF